MRYPRHLSSGIHGPKSASRDRFRFRDPAIRYVSRLPVILRARRPGIYHASGDRDLPYTRLAETMCAALGVPLSLVSVADSGRAAQHTTLDMSLERDLFGLLQPASEDAIRDTLRAAI